MIKFLRTICAILALCLIGCDKGDDHRVIPDISVPSLGTPPNNEIWFQTSEYGETIEFDQSAFDSEVTDVIYSDYDHHTIRFASNITTIGEEAFYNCGNLFNISLPNSVVTIGKRAFYMCKRMESMTIGNGLRLCQEDAFEGCEDNLYALYIPSIGSWCRIEFENFKANPAYYAQTLTLNGNKVEQLTIPNSVQEIKAYAFYGNTALTEVSIPASVGTIGQSAFEGCENLSKVSAEEISSWCNIDFANETANPISIAGVLYTDNAPLTNLTLAGIKEVKPRAFIRCNSLQTISTDETLTTIGSEAFRACSALTTAELGEGVLTIGEKGFMGCESLAEIECRAIAPPLLEDRYVFDYNAKERKIYVPTESVDAYITAEGWSKYADSITAIQ